MQVPTVHLNGTSKEGLVKPLAEAYDAIDLAYDALKRTAPNGRDYYPQGDGALVQAGAEHMDRLRRLDAIKEELQQLILLIDEQQ